MQGAENEFQVAKIEFQGPLAYLPTRIASRVAGSIAAQCFQSVFKKRSKVFCILLRFDMIKKRFFGKKTFLSLIFIRYEFD